MNTLEPLTGPVFPIPTPFTPDGREVDHRALARYVEFLLAGGAATLLVTVGTSRFNLLSGREMMAVSRTVAQAAGGRAQVIAAGPPQGPLARHLEFADEAGRMGAAGVILVYPERFYGEPDVLDFFAEACRVSPVSVLAHEMPMVSGFFGSPVQYSLALLERMVELPGFAGFKEEAGDPGHIYRLLRAFSERCQIIGAGSMRCYLRDCQAGAKAYLTGIGNFLPGLALEFHRAAAAGDFALARRIARANEDPYFDFAVSLGWHRALKETMAILGLMPPHERPPLRRLDQEQRQELAALVERLGWK